MLDILRIAPLSSVQDGGRDAWRAVGVPRSGPLDEWSHAVANVLVGNPAEAAALEIGYGRSQLRFRRPALVAVTGARAPVQIDGVSMPSWRPIVVAAGATLGIEPAQSGARSYLAISGGLATPAVLGSRSGLLQQPGFPPALRSGDHLDYDEGVGAVWSALRRRAGGANWAVPWWADGEPLLDLDAHAGLRVMEGAHAHLLQDRRALYTGSFALSTATNRMAAPLSGDVLSIADAATLISEPVVPGTVQLPPDGRPVVLLAEAQTVGGYARIAHVARIDLARLAQRRPGSRIRFEPISVEAAQRLWLWRRERLMRLRIAALARLRGA